MQWEKLLCATRYINSKNKETRSPYLVDVDRITYSSHFRKLQDKTQVHPLAKSDYVRTRLTHSLEVAGVGRSMGYAVGVDLIKKYNLQNISEHDFGYLVQASCLMHDIGNPPFGHLAEEVIQEFFRDKSNYLKNYLSTEEVADLLNFDGNAQGFRIATKLAGGWKFNGGLRLTYATLGTFLKYPRTYIPHETLNTNIIGTKKIGIFQSEADFFADLTKKLEMKPCIKNALSFYRHPLTFLLEAADDICYCVADLEDAFFVGLATLKDIENLLAPIARSPRKYEGTAVERRSRLRNEDFYKDMNNRQKIEFLRGSAIGNLISEVIEVFLNNEENILNSHFNQELIELTPFAGEIQACREYAENFIFQSHDKISGEIIGMGAVEGSLEELYKMVLNPANPKCKRVANLVGYKYTKDEPLYQRLLSIIDIIADFTDRNLLEFYKVLKSV